MWLGSEKPFATISEQGGGEERKKRKKSVCCFLVSFCSPTEHLEFLFEEIQKQIDCKGSRVSAGLWKSRLCLILSLSLFPTIPCCLWRLNCIQYTSELVFSCFLPILCQKCCPMPHTETNVWNNVELFGNRDTKCLLSASFFFTFKTLRHRRLATSH